MNRFTRRDWLGAAAAAVLAVPQGSRAQLPAASRADPWLGRWKVAAAKEGGNGATDHATLSKGSDTGYLLSVEGEVAQLLGGPVALAGRGAQTLGGTARTGVEATLRALDERRLSLTLQGQGIYFSLFLLK